VADDTLYFLVNHQADAVDGWVGLATPGAAAAVLMDPLTCRIGNAEFRTVDGRVEVRLQLEPGESVFLKLQQLPAGKTQAWPYAEPVGESRELAGEWRVTPLTGGPEMPTPFSTTTLRSWTEQGGEWERFAGTAAYEMVFELEQSDVDAAGDWRLDLGDLREVARVKVNGQEVDCVWSLPFSCRLGGHLRAGRNRLVLEVTNLAANRIRDLDQRGVAWKKFHEINFVDVHYKRFDASGWPLQPSGLLGPVHLVPLR